MTKCREDMFSQQSKLIADVNGLAHGTRSLQCQTKFALDILEKLNTLDSALQEPCLGMKNFCLALTTPDSSALLHYLQFYLANLKLMRALAEQKIPDTNFAVPAFRPINSFISELTKKNIDLENAAQSNCLLLFLLLLLLCIK